MFFSRIELHHWALLRGLGCWQRSRIMLLWIPSNWRIFFFKLTINKMLQRFIFPTTLQNILKWDKWEHNNYINMSQLCMVQNEPGACRKMPVMVLCIHSSPWREVMQSCKLLQTIAVGWLYLFRTGSEERNQLRHCSLPTLGFFKICRFWYSSLTPSSLCAYYIQW